MTTIPSRSSLRTEENPVLSFKDYSKVLLRLSKVTDELHDIDKRTGGEFSRMDKEDSSGDSAPIGSSDSKLSGTKEL